MIPSLELAKHEPGRLSPYEDSGMKNSEKSNTIIADGGRITLTKLDSQSPDHQLPWSLPQVERPAPRRGAAEKLKPQLDIPDVAGLLGQIDECVDEEAGVGVVSKPAPRLRGKELASQMLPFRWSQGGRRATSPPSVLAMSWWP